MKRLLFACAALALAACQDKAPSPEPPAKPLQADAESVEYTAYKKQVHDAIIPAPADFRTKPCIYVARWNVGGTYDAARQLGDGASRDGGSFAYLGEENGTIKVAAENHRLDSLSLYPEAKDEPKWIVLHFAPGALSFKQEETAWVQSGQKPIDDGACMA